MSNTNPILVAAILIVGSGSVTACSIMNPGHDDARPFRTAAERVVSDVADYTSLSARCRKIGALIVESAITKKLSSTGGEYRHAALVEAVVGVEWEKSDCPSAAVPGLSFGAAAAANDMARGAHKAARLR